MHVRTRSMLVPALTGLIAASAGCGSSGGAAPAALSGGPPSTFRSYNVPPITAANGVDCTTLRGSTGTAKRPMCATTAFVLPNQCRITGVRAGCQCYEGQAHACTPPTGTTPCPSGTGCGIRACLVTSDSSSTWSSSCYPL